MRRRERGVPATVSLDLLSSLSVGHVFSSVAVRVDGPRVWDEHLVLSWVFTDLGATFVTELRNGVLAPAGPDFAIVTA